MTVYEVKAILGHSDIRTTMRYAHLEQRQVAIKARDVLEHLGEAEICDRNF
jgi:site-specific recombinase XerD